MQQSNCFPKSCRSRRYTIRVIAWFVAIIFTVLPSSAQLWAQAPLSLQWYQVNTKNVLDNARNKIEPSLPATERDLARSITYRVTAAPGIGAFAAYEGNQRVIVIHAGTIQAVDWMFDAAWMENELNLPGCFKEYANYYYQGLQTNQNRVDSRLAPLPVAAPLTFAQAQGHKCAGATPQRMMSSSGYGARKAGAIEASIVFLYLHELGHHILRHTDGKRTDDPAGLAMSRNQEDAADRYAVGAALRAQYALTAAMPWHSLMALVGGNSIEAEKKSSHPLGVSRVLSIYRQTEQYYRQNPQQWRNPSTYDAGMQELANAIGELEAEVNSLK
mgnify:FL=1